MVLGIAPMAIIDRQLPFEYTITSRSTDVVVMAQPIQNINHSAFRSIFEREKLFGNNFNDWFCQLKLVLRVEKKIYLIEQPLPAAPAVDSEAQVLSQWNAVYDAYNEVACLILGSMTPELHRQFKSSSPYDMIKELKAMFEKQAGLERFDLIQTFHACKQEEGKPVAAYVIQMKGYVDQLKHLGYMLPQDLIVGLILNGLTKDFAGFGLPLKAETPQVMMIKGCKIQKAKKKLLKAKGKGKANGKGNDKQVYIPKPKNPKPSAKEHPTKDDTCHHCKEVGHWKRNCHVYLVELLKKKKQVGSASSSISKNNVFYFNAIPGNGMYEIDMHDLVPNINSINNVNTKRAKYNLDSTYLWHCRLAHISKKRIEKLQQEGLLKSTDDESCDQCVSCLSGKMTRKPFPHRPEWATDLLRIIHTDVCGPLRHVSRQGASYFITSTDDYSRYDWGGEYISQEFKDYLKACGIIKRLTPLYTPQHNGVSKRRNHTLLDMVQSMMNLTTLPLSFWDYALESATRILNVVPTKKGCEALVKRDTPDKLQQRSVKSQWRAMDLEEIQDVDTSASEITSEIPMEVEGFEPPQEEVIPVHRSERTHRAPDRLCLNVEA
ncbi:retrotransposon protein, putative, ty1-copia subclass [Tanacetum coccineum]